ncbi:YesL family protein [Alloscardovia omnicolens]|uniref:YesL family protein n=1 Tax=Alloscardovia omnicolens TaxID=419015 RepID=UPI003A68D3BA
MAKFAVFYEKLCRLILMIFIVNVAIFVHTLVGVVVVGFFPSIAAAHNTYRVWLLSEDRAWRVRHIWLVFHREWKANLGLANRFGWIQLGISLLLAYDYFIVNWNVRTGMLGVVLSGFFVVLLAFMLIHSAMVWAVQSHFEESIMWIMRYSFSMVIARPLCSIMLGCSMFIISWCYVQWPGLIIAFGLSAYACATQVLVYSFAKLPGLTPVRVEARAS